MPIEGLKQHKLAAVMEVLLKVSRSKNNLAVIRGLAEEGFLRTVVDHTSHIYLSDLFDYAMKCEENNQQVEELLDFYNCIT